MRKYRKAQKYIFRRARLLLLYTVYYFLVAELLSAISLPVKRHQEEKVVSIFVSSNGVHTDISVPAENSEMNWLKKLPFQNKKSGNTVFHYLSFGIGNREFYLNTKDWSDLKWSTAIKAAFYAGKSALHLTYLNNQPLPGKKCRELKLTRSQYKSLCDFLDRSFEKENGKYKRIPHPGYDHNDCFYEATPPYGIFHTCNNWTSNALRRSDCKVGIWTPFDWNVLNSLEE